MLSLRRFQTDRATSGITKLVLRRAFINLGNITSLLFTLIMALPAHVNAGSKHSQSFTLYSWITITRGYHFAILPEARNRGFLKHVKQSDHQIATVTALKKQLASLPAHSVVAWRNAPEYGIDYPPDALKARIEAYAAEKGITMEIIPVLYDY
jgi:hypothetical protein